MGKSHGSPRNARNFGAYAKGPGAIAASLRIFLPTLGEGAELVDEAFLEKTLPVEAVDDPRLELAKLALKAIAYINSAGADALEMPAPAEEIEERLSRVGPGKAKKLERQLERASGQAYIYVGSRLPVMREDLVEVRAPGVRKLTYRFKVRGHFHSFWKLRKNLREDEKSWIKIEEDGWVLVTKWIHPYEKGPEPAELVERRYYVR